MSGFLRDSWNYVGLGCAIYRCYTDWCETKSFRNGNFESLIKRIHGCGSVAIKFVQWIKPLVELVVIDEDEFYKEEPDMPWWLRKLDVFYENCREHEIEYTLQEYYRTFGEDLSETHDILDILGSGSIGQVYLIRRKDTKKQTVLKIIHPRVLSQIDTFERWYRLSGWIPPIRRILAKFPIDITDFINSFRTQCDLIQETNSLLKIQRTYRDNKYIHIPEIYLTSKNIIEMEYLEGGSLDDVQISTYEKAKLFTHLYMFMRNNIICENFNHGDLHKGNWKVHPEEGIILYDFGFCWSLPESRIHLVDKCLTVFEGAVVTNRMDTVKNIADIMFILVLHQNVKDKESLYSEMKHHISVSPFVGASKQGLIVQPIAVIKLLFGFCEGKELQIDHNLLQFLILFIELQKHGIRYGFASCMTDPYPNEMVFKERYANCLNFCETYQVYPKYRDYVKQMLSDLQISRTSIFDMVEFSEDIRLMAIQ
jgi:predicted unusual protein kinase regulating ubiquinone biosynthesis (AarF/ABC1/UbiB family)